MSEEYLSLYEFLGRKSDHGKDVYKYSQEQNIKTGYRELPKDYNANYEGVITYPRAFLEEYFKAKPAEPLSAIVRQNSPEIKELKILCKRVDALENEILLLKNELTKKADNTQLTIDFEEDELPF
tara:strand:+ start:79 stop:453 length:375 start_codon:yes stop_codon:yes gene_type:complete